MHAVFSRLVSTFAFLSMSIIAQNVDARPGKGNGGGGWSSSPTPILSFAADRTEVAPGERVLLSWASANVKNCSASGDWDGRQSTEGSYQTPTLTASASYTLKCTSSGGGVTQTVDVLVAAVTAPEPILDPALDTATEPAPDPVLDPATDPTLDPTLDPTTDPALDPTLDPTTDPALDPTLDPTTDPALDPTLDPTTDPTLDPTTDPAPNPTLTLTASSQAVRSGESATLSWTGEGVSNCQASGAWSGPRSATGSELVGPLLSNSSYTLTCDSATDKLFAVTTVLVTEGGTTISWQAPTQNVDGSALNDLAAFRIYVGTTSRSYDTQIDVIDPRASSRFVELLPGDYVFAMTAIDADGNESAFSNEVAKTVN